MDGKEVELELWDTAGQEDYDNIRDLAYTVVGEYIRDPWAMGRFTRRSSGPNFHKLRIFLFTDIILLLCSYDHHFSLINVKDRWIPDIREHNETVPIFLIASKSDLKDDIDSKVT